MTDDRTCRHGDEFICPDCLDHLHELVAMINAEAADDHRREDERARLDLLPDAPGTDGDDLTHQPY